MAENGFKRKLTAILSADVEGYSRLMDDNEEATVLTGVSGIIPSNRWKPTPNKHFSQSTL